MKPQVMIIIVGGIVLFGFLRRRRRKNRTPIDRIKGGVETAIDEIGSRSSELRKRADKARGEAKQRLQDQARVLESRQRDLLGRLEELGAEARRIMTQPPAETAADAAAEARR